MFNHWPAWIAQVFRLGNRPIRRPARRSTHRLLIECLEDRITPSNDLLVTNINATGPGSLQQAILNDNGLAVPGTITFAPGLTGTITLSALLELSNINGSPANPESIAGPGSGQLTVSGGNAVSIFLVDGSVAAAISGLTITDSGGSGGSGAITNEGTLTVQNCAITNNTTQGIGAGIYNTGSLAVVGGTISGNTALGGAGGGIYNSFGTMTVTGTTLSGNTAKGGGGGIYNNTGTVTLVNTTLSGNSAAQGHGGAIFNDPTHGPPPPPSGGTLTAINCTINGNSAEDGGGIFNAASATLNLNNTIVAGNTATAGTGADIENDSTVNANYSLIGNTSESGISAGTGNILDPAVLGLDSLKSNGGTNQTIALLPGSPAIDAGSNGLAIDAQGSPLSTDQRGRPRIANNVVDMGAFEVQAPANNQVAIGLLTPVANGPDGQLQVSRTDISGTLTATVFITTASTAPNFALTADLGIAAPSNPSNFSYTSSTSGGITTYTVIFVFADQALAAVFDVNGVTAGHEADAVVITVTATLQAVTGSSSTGPYTIDPNNQGVSGRLGGNGLVVTNTNAAGNGSLEQALVNDNSLVVPGTISFAAGLSGTITPASTLELSNTGSNAARPEEIDGSGAAALTISAAGAVDTVTVGTGVTAAFAGLNIGGPDNNDNSFGTIINLAHGATLSLAGGTYAGGTTFNVGAGDKATIHSGTFTGGATFNVAAGAIVDLTGGLGINQPNPVTYSGTLTGSGLGTVQLSGGRMGIGLGGLTLDFAGGMFQWTGGILDGAEGDAINLGTINLAGSSDMIFADYGTLDNYGTLIQTGAGNLGLASSGAAFTTLKIEPGASYLLESDSGIDSWDGGPARSKMPAPSARQRAAARPSCSARATSTTPAPSRLTPARSGLPIQSSRTRVPASVR